MMTIPRKKSHNLPAIQFTRYGTLLGAFKSPTRDEDLYGGFIFVFQILYFNVR